MKYIYLNQSFYTRYQEHEYKEILTKAERPFVQVVLSINQQLWAVPLRSHIPHNYAILTDTNKRSGLDLTKAVPISKEDIAYNQTPWIRQHDFDALKGKDWLIEKELIRFIKKYLKAKENPHIKRHQFILRYSTLQYFEDKLILTSSIKLRFTRSINGRQR